MALVASWDECPFRNAVQNRPPGRYTPPWGDHGACPWLWVDVETTSLDTDTAKVLEVAFVRTTVDLQPMEDITVVIRHDQPLVTSEWCGGQFAPRHQGGNGLLEDVAASQTSHDSAEERLIGFVRMHLQACGIRQCMLAGASVAFDKAVLAKSMPILSQLLHYRTVDVSALQEMLRVYRPVALPPRQRGQRPCQHRAKADVLESIAFFRHMLTASITRRGA